LVGQLPSERLSWLVPGLLVEKMTALIRALPKDTRRGLGPANDAAFFCLQHMAPHDDESLVQCMSRTFLEQRGIRVPVDEWDETALLPHLRMNIEVTDGAGEVLAHGRDPAALRERIADLAPPEETDSEPLPSWVRDGLTGWTIDELPETIEHRRAGVRLRFFVALRDDGDSVSVALYDHERVAREAMAAGIGRLLRLQAADRLKYLRRNLPQIDRMCLNFAAVGSCDLLKRDIIDATVARARSTDPWRIRSRAAFDSEASRLRERLVPVAADICRTLAPALELVRKCLSMIDTLPAGSRNDIAQQLDLLVFPGFVAYTPAERLDSFGRYLRGVQKRIERCARNPGQDAARMQRIAGYWNRLLREYPPPPDPVPPELFEFRWLLEEFRVSVFAQELGTAQSVSEKRLDDQWNQYRRSAP
jgi:ATP-dependent helicase HrpA